MWHWVEIRCSHCGTITAAQLSTQTTKDKEDSKVLCPPCADTHNYIAFRLLEASPAFCDNLTIQNKNQKSRTILPTQKAKAEFARLHWAETKEEDYGDIEW